MIYKQQSQQQSENDGNKSSMSETRNPKKTLRITTPRLIMSQADLAVAGSVEFLASLLSQSHVRESLFSMASQSLLKPTISASSASIQSQGNKDARKRSSGLAWNDSQVNELVKFWKQEEGKGHGCGLYLIYHKEKENLNLHLSSKEEETHPPRKAMRTREDRHSISGQGSSSATSKAFKTVHGRRIGVSLESRLPIGLVAVSFTDPSTRMLDLVISFEHQGEGYATEASKAILRHTFSSPLTLPDQDGSSSQLPLSMRNLFSSNSQDNSSYPKSRQPSLVTKIASFVENDSDQDVGWFRVLEKLGFRHTSCSIAMNKVKVDVCSITRDEFVDLWMEE